MELKMLESWITTEVNMMSKLKPITPGEFLLEESLKPMGLSQYRLAKEVRIPAQRISEIVAGKRSITADTDMRLCKFLGLSNGYWLRAQAVHDTEVAERKMGPVLTKIKPWSSVMAQQSAENDTPKKRASKLGRYDTSRINPKSPKTFIPSSLTRATLHICRQSIQGKSSVQSSQ
jgi:addiction module HigA family antidote